MRARGRERREDTRGRPGVARLPPPIGGWTPFLGKDGMERVPSLGHTFTAEAAMFPLSLPRSCALVALLCIGSASADDYYVDLDAGSDAAAGTMVAPWRTLTYAMATVAPSSGHRVLVRGTANTSSPGESFPIRVPAGVSLEAWDALQGALIDASPQPCLVIEGPADRAQRVRGYARNLRLVGTPAIAVDVLGPEESVDLLVESCALWGDFRMELAEVSGLTRWGRCLLTMRDCEISGALNVACLSSSISAHHDVLMVSLYDNVLYGPALLRRLSAPGRHLEVLRNRGDQQFHIDQCLAATAWIQDNVFRSFDAELSSVSTLYQGNETWFGMIRIATDGYLEVLANRTDQGPLIVRGAGTAKIHDNVMSDGWLGFESAGALSSACSVLRNSGTWLQIDAHGEQPLTVAENSLNGPLYLNSLPSAEVRVERNRIWPEFPWDGILVRGVIASQFPEAPRLSIVGNRIASFFRYGSGISIDTTLAKLVIEDNAIDRFAIGIEVAPASVVHGSPEGWSFRVERNSITRCEVGVDLGLASSQEDLRFLNNEIEGYANGVVLRRESYRGTIRFWNNILRSYNSSAFSGDFAPIDLVRSNLATDGSLLAWHETNSSGDPQFDPSTGDLRASSPAVGSGIDPLTALPGFNMGRDPLQPPAKLHFRASSESEATLRLEAPEASVAILLVDAAVSQPANIALCDGLAGVAFSGAFFSLSFPVADGTLLLPLTLPPGPWTVAVQALSDVASAVPPCRLSNTVVVRR
jgi:hypothetical protein